MLEHLQAHVERTDLVLKHRVAPHDKGLRGHALDDHRLGIDIHGRRRAGTRQLADVGPQPRLHEHVPRPIGGDLLGSGRRAGDGGQFVVAVAGDGHAARAQASGPASGRHDPADRAGYAGDEFDRGMLLALGHDRAGLHPIPLLDAGLEEHSGRMHEPQMDLRGQGSGLYGRSRGPSEPETVSLGQFQLVGHANETRAGREIERAGPKTRKSPCPEGSAERSQHSRRGPVCQPWLSGRYVRCARRVRCVRLGLPTKPLKAGVRRPGHERRGLPAAAGVRTMVRSYLRSPCAGHGRGAPPVRPRWFQTRIPDQWLSLCSQSALVEPGPCSRPRPRSGCARAGART